MVVWRAWRRGARRVPPRGAAQFSEGLSDETGAPTTARTHQIYSTEIMNPPPAHVTGVPPPAHVTGAPPPAHAAGRAGVRFFATTKTNKRNFHYIGRTPNRNSFASAEAHVLGARRATPWQVEQRIPASQVSHVPQAYGRHVTGIRECMYVSVYETMPGASSAARHAPSPAGMRRARSLRIRHICVRLHTRIILAYRGTARAAP